MTEPNPTPPITPRAAAERICELAGSPDFDAVAMINQLAPLLARAWEEEHPELVWKSKALLGELPGEDLFQWRDGEDRGVTLGWEMNLWEADVEIACLASNGQPWPISLLEVQEP